MALKEEIDGIWKKALSPMPQQNLVIDLLGEPVFNKKYQDIMKDLSKEPNGNVFLPIFNLAHKYLLLKDKLKKLEDGK